MTVDDPSDEQIIQPFLQFSPDFDYFRRGWLGETLFFQKSALHFCDILGSSVLRLDVNFVIIDFKVVERLEFVPFSGRLFLQFLQ